MKKRQTLDKNLRAMVFGRSHGLCDRCGAALGVVWECHHRQLRSRGGADSMANLVALCPGCHGWAHRNVTVATAFGFICPSWQDPAGWPIKQFGLRWMLPGEEWMHAEPHEDQRPKTREAS